VSRRKLQQPTRAVAPKVPVPRARATYSIEPLATRQFGPKVHRQCECTLGCQYVCAAASRRVSPARDARRGGSRERETPRLRRDSQDQAPASRLGAHWPRTTTTTTTTRPTLMQQFILSIATKWLPHQHDTILCMQSFSVTSRQASVVSSLRLFILINLERSICGPPRWSDEDCNKWLTFNLRGSAVSQPQAGSSHPHKLQVGHEHCRRVTLPCSTLSATPGAHREQVSPARQHQQPWPPEADVLAQDRTRASHVRPN